MQLVSAADAATRRYFIDLPNGAGNWVDSYMGITPAEARSRKREIATGEGGPVAYLVEQPPQFKVAGHYHQVDEFQVFVASDGRFGATLLSGIYLHYAAAFTPYAPIAAGHEALKYFTMRRGFDPGAQWMPESKERLLSKERRFRAETSRIDPRPQEPGIAAQTIVIAPDESGLGAWMYELGAHGRAETPSPSEGGGQFLLVLDGECTIDDAHARRYDIAHVAPDGHAPMIVAGERGAALVVVRFASASR